MRRRRAIQFAAMRLFAERGYDATTVADIATEAEVATRTVPMYFPTKLDIALSSTNAAAERLTRALEEHGSGTPLVDTFMEWLHGEAAHVDEEEWRLRAAMFEANPALSVTGSRQTEALARTAARLLGLQLGIPSDHAAVRLTVGAVSGVFLQYELLPTGRDDASAVLDTMRAALEGLVRGVEAQLGQTS